MMAKRNIADLEAAKRNLCAAQTYAYVRTALYEREKKKCRKLEENGASEFKLYEQNAEVERQYKKALEAAEKSRLAQSEYEKVSAMCTAAVQGGSV